MLGKGNHELRSHGAPQQGFAPLGVTALGVTVRHAFDDAASPNFVAVAKAAWADAEVTDATPDRTLQVSDNGDPEYALSKLSVDTTLAALEHRRGELLMFHACGVADAHGRVAAFVGPSGRGKTTLSRALGQHFGYVSDETIAVDESLTVHPYRKPLSVVRADTHKEQVAPSEAGLQALPEATLQLGALVLLDRVEHAPEPSIEPVSFVDAIEALVPQMSYLAEVPQAVQRLASAAEAVGGFVRLTYSEASSIVAVVPELLARPAVALNWQAATGGIAGSFSTDSVADAIRIDDKVVLLADKQIQVLDGIAPAIWDAVRDSKDFDSIVRHVVSVHGEPGGVQPDSVVRTAINELIAAGLVTGDWGESSVS